MENTQERTPTEAAGFAAGVGVGTFRVVFRGKHMSAAIVVLAGAILLLGGSFIRHGQTQAFLQVVGCVIGAVGFIGWIFGSSGD